MKRLTIKHKFRKNAVLKGASFTEGAAAKERNRKIGDIRRDRDSKKDKCGKLSLV